MPLTPEEALEIADSLDAIIRFLQTSGQDYEFVALWYTLTSGLSGLTAAAAATQGGAAFLAGIGLTAASVVAVGIVIAAIALIGGTILYLEGNAMKNAAESLGRFSDALRNAAEIAGPDDILALRVERNFLAGDRISLTTGPYNARVVYSDTTSIMDKSGRTLIDMMRSYADTTGSPVRISYWYGTYDYYGNGIWVQR